MQTSSSAETQNERLVWGAQAVAAAKGAWGERQLAELEAEDRLAVACERAPTSDPVIAKLRAAFQVHPPSPSPFSLR